MCLCAKYAFSESRWSSCVSPHHEHTNMTHINHKALRGRTGLGIQGTRCVPGVQCHPHLAPHAEQPKCAHGGMFWVFGIFFTHPTCHPHPACASPPASWL